MDEADVCLISDLLVKEALLDDISVLLLLFLLHCGVESCAPHSHFL